MSAGRRLDEHAAIWSVVDGQPTGWCGTWCNVRKRDPRSRRRVCRWEGRWLRSNRRDQRVRDEVRKMRRVQRMDRGT